MRARKARKQMVKTEALFHLVEQHGSVEKVAEVIGEEKCVLRARIRHIPHLHNHVQRLMQRPYRPAALTESRAQYKSRLRKDLCVFCGRHPVDVGSKMTIDHIVPVSKGGPNTVENIAAACSSCNSRKSDTDLLTFMLSERD